MYYTDVVYPDGTESDGTLDTLPEVGDNFEGYTVIKVRQLDEEVEPGIPIWEVTLGK